MVLRPRVRASPRFLERGNDNTALRGLGAPLQSNVNSLLGNTSAIASARIERESMGSFAREMGEQYGKTAGSAFLFSFPRGPGLAECV